MTELCDESAVELRRRIGAKEISPVELLESCIKRIERVNPTLNAVVATIYDRARKEAKAAEEKVMRGEALGVLHGLPLGVKDLDETEGLRTTWGSPLYKDNVPARDNRMVAACRAAGAIVTAKTNVPEFGAGANTNNPVYGPTGNPFDPKRTCGGSSGGSAVALATGMFPICTGSDTGGSLRIPAAFCGIVGYRPSPGVVPSDRRVLGWTNLSVLGPMGRNVADTSLLLSAQAGFDSCDPLSHPIDATQFRTIQDIDLSKLRVAVSVDLGFSPMDDRLRKTFAERVAMFKHVFKSCEERDPDMTGADDAFEIMRAQNFLAGQRARYEKHKDQLGPNIVANYEQGLGYSAPDVARGHELQTQIYRRFQTFFKDIDVLITPTLSTPPFPWTQRYVAEMNGQKLRTYFHWLAPTYGITLTGHPCISIPCGLEPTGTPFHLQIVGPHYGDRFTLGVAHALEQYMAHVPALARPLPDLEALSKK
jgi:Asp-tRNA(Asn)/Glu-tRNA(Gln) amidotransferase A subunit family amidase